MDDSTAGAGEDVIPGFGVGDELEEQELAEEDKSETTDDADIVRSQMKDRYFNPLLHPKSSETGRFILANNILSGGGSSNSTGGSSNSSGSSRSNGSGGGGNNKKKGKGGTVYSDNNSTKSKFDAKMKQSPRGRNELKRKVFFDKSCLEAHFGSGGDSDHSDDYKGMTPEEYEAFGVETLESACDSKIRGFLHQDGDLVRYRVDTNDFVKGNILMV